MCEKQRRIWSRVSCSSENHTFSFVKVKFMGKGQFGVLYFSFFLSYFLWFFFFLRDIGVVCFFFSFLSSFFEWDCCVVLVSFNECFLGYNYLFHFFNLLVKQFVCFFFLKKNTKLSSYFNDKCYKNFIFYSY